MDTLTLGYGYRKGETFKSSTIKAERKYIDFIVSGQSLGQLFGLPEFDLIGTFGWTDNKEYENKQIEEFLGLSKPELETGRTCLYVCSECGDIGCGAITASIEVSGKQVIWKDFAYENNYSQPDLTDYKQIGPFTFDKAQYDTTFERLKTPSTKMNATIYSHRTIIGTADLQVGDEGMGCLFGQFIPNDNYFKDIQKIVWEFWKTNKMNYDKWLSFRFNARLDNGFFLFPYGGYTFVDSPDFPDEPKRIEIAGIDLEILNFNSETLLEPWYTIDLERKIYYEDELLREITPPNSFFSFIGLGKKKNHTLFGAEISAFAKYGPNDEVLFQVKKKGNQNQFATVHLTFSKKENIQPSIYPGTHFFIDFQDFAEKRMKPDNQEWNG